VRRAALLAAAGQVQPAVTVQWFTSPSAS
jgi:hypothetical protein